MSEFGPCTSTVLATMATTFRDDFEGRFRPLYEDTVEMLEAHPREPETEAFNAFEHFSLAFKFADLADVPGAAPEVVANAKREIDKNLGQALRHLSVGRFFCLEHQIIRTMEGIIALVTALPEEERAAKAGYQQRCSELEAEFRSHEAIDIQPIEDPIQLEQAVNGFEKTIDNMTKLLVKFLQLADDIAGPAPPFAAAP